jgi:hypothetical protein
VLRELAQEERQRHRIRATGKANEHTAPGRTQRVSPDGAPDLLEKRSQPRDELGLASMRTCTANRSSFRKPTGPPSRFALRVGNLRLQ